MARLLAVGTLVFAVLVVAARPAQAYYWPLMTTELIGLSDLVVLGTIQRVDAEHFVLRVDRELYGRRAEAHALTVRRFHDWPCASRWGPYQSGQRLILFLKAAATGSEPWHILGAGDEGEWLVEGDTVYYMPWPDRRHRSRTYNVGGGRFYGVEVPLGDVVAALAQYRSIWRLVTDDHGWGRDVVLVGMQEVAAQFSRSSLFHRSLALQSSNFVEASRYR